jgi:hypothetical protein
MSLSDQIADNVKAKFKECLEAFKAVPEVSAIYADSMYVFVFYDTPKYSTALITKFYSIEGEYIDSNYYVLKTFYYVPECMIEDPDEVVRNTPLMYIRDSIDRIGEL